MEIAPRRGWRGIDLGELWRYRELLGFLVWRDIAVRYKQTVIGVAWAVLQPVCTMVIFSLVFGRIARIPSDGMPYPLFVYAGLLPWLLFGNAVAQASLSLVSQSQLLTKVYFPRLFIPATSVGVGIMDFALSLVVYFGLLTWFGVGVDLSVLAVPLLVVLTALTAFGVGTFFASLTIVYRDFRLVVPFVVQSWMYLSPVVYPVSLVPEGYRWLLLLNPMTGIIDGFRAALLGQPWNLTALAASVLVAVLLAVIGVVNFRRSERRFADVA